MDSLHCIALHAHPPLGVRLRPKCALDIAARVTNGGVMPDGSQGKQGSVLVLSGEDGDDDTVKPRLLEAGCNENRVHCLSSITDEDGERPILIPNDLQWLSEKGSDPLPDRIQIAQPLEKSTGRHGV